MSLTDEDIFAQGAAGLALAADALAEAAQALSEAAAALSSMSYDDDRSNTVHQSLARATDVPEAQEIDDEIDQIQDIDDDGRSISVHGGNNAHWNGPMPEYTSNNLPRPRDPASHSQAEPESVRRQEPPLTSSLSGQLFPGRFYVVLEEEFDALPLISAYAAAAKRTTCYVPTSGSLFPWELILSGIIPDRQVRSAISFSGRSIMQFNEVVQHLASSDNGSVLVLRSGYIVRANGNNAHSMSDSLIFWGLPGPKYWPNLMQAVHQPRHTLLILNKREYHDQACQDFLINQGLGSSFIAHPLHSEINSFEPNSILAGFRNNVQRIISTAQYSQNIQTLYEELLESPIDNTGQLHCAAKSAVERIDLVNKFMARVFLRGCMQDGSLRFPFEGQGLQIPEKSYNRLGIVFGMNNQSKKSNATSRKGITIKPASEANQNAAPPVNSSINQHPGWWRITLKQDADVIPLISYLSHHHPKSLCSISHSDRGSAYGGLFGKLSTYKVVAPGQNKNSVEKRLQEYSDVSMKSGLCLLPGRPQSGVDNYDNFKNVKADALIYWGLPATGSFLWPTRVSRDQFDHIYLIIPPDQLSTASNPVLAGDFQEYPDSKLLNTQGPSSRLHLFREKAKPALLALSRGSLLSISRYYSPAHPPAYHALDFIRKVMMRPNYS